MISGRPPFRCESISELYFQIKTVKYTCPQNFSKQLQDLLARILVRNPLKRVSMDGLRFDPWVLADDSNPPKRIEPRIKVDERENGTDLDGEIDALLLSIQEFDGMTVYDFKSTGSDGIAIKFHEKDDREKSKSQESTKPSNLPVIPSVTIHDHDAPNQSSSVNEKTGLFPMLTLGRGKAKTDDAASKTMAVPVSSGRQRSKSISPETNAYEMAKKFEALKDMPVSAYVDAAPSVKPAASVVLAAPVHRRRHSVSVGVPNAVPDGFGPSNPGSQTGISGNKSTAAPTEKRDTKSPGIENLSIYHFVSLFYDLLQEYPK
jgi:serine/threonine protein kinase